MRRSPVFALAFAAILLFFLAASAKAELRVEPRLTLRGEYDTNIISLGFEGVDGMLFIISPSLGLRGEVLRTNFMVDLGIDVWRYRDLDPNDGIDLTSFNTEAPFVNASVGRLLLGNVGVEVGVGYRKDLTMTHQFDVSNDYFRTPFEYYTGTLKLAWNATTRSKIQGGVTYGRVDYEEGGTPANSIGMGYDLGLSYRLTEKLSFGAALNHDVREYDPNDTAKSTSFSGQFGYRLDRTYSVEAKGSIDYLEPGGGLDPETLWTAAVIGKGEGPRTLFQVDLHRSRGQIREQGGMPQTDGASLQMSYKPTAKLSLQGSGTYDKVDYSAVPLENASRRDDFLKASFRVTYEAFKDIFIRGDYAYIHRDSNTDPYDYGNHQIGLSLVGRLSLL